MATLTPTEWSTHDGAVVPGWTLGSRRTWLATLHLATDLPVGMLWGTTVLALLAASVGLLPAALLGAPLLLLTLAGCLLVARLERRRAAALLGVQLGPAPELPRTWRTWVGLLVSAPAWKATAYAVLLPALGLVTTTTVLTGWGLALAGATSQVWLWLVPGAAVALPGVTLTGETAVLLLTVLGVALALAMPTVVRLLAALDRWLVRVLLG